MRCHKSPVQGPVPPTKHVQDVIEAPDGRHWRI